MEVFYSFLILLCTSILLFIGVLFVFYFFSRSKNIRLHKMGIGYLSDYFPKYVLKTARCCSFKDCVKCSFYNCPYSRSNKSVFDAIADTYIDENEFSRLSNNIL